MFAGGLTAEGLGGEDCGLSLLTKVGSPLTPSPLFSSARWNENMGRGAASVL